MDLSSFAHRLYFRRCRSYIFSRSETSRRRRKCRYSPTWSPRLVEFPVKLWEKWATLCTSAPWTSPVLTLPPSHTSFSPPSLSPFSFCTLTLFFCCWLSFCSHCFFYFTDSPYCSWSFPFPLLSLIPLTPPFSIVANKASRISQCASLCVWTLIGKLRPKRMSSSYTFADKTHLHPSNSELRFLTPPSIVCALSCKIRLFIQVNTIKKICRDRT